MVKLAFWDTVGAAFWFVISKPLTVLRTGWLWAIILIAPSVWFSVLIGWRGSGVITYVVLPVSLVVFSVLSVATSVSWQVALNRAILKDENSWSAVFQFRYRHWRLIGVNFLIGLICFLPFAVLFSAAFILFHSPLRHIAPGTLLNKVIVIGMVFIFFASFIGFFGTWARLSLAYPAIAIDDPAKSIRAAWRRTKRNSIRLFFGLCICTIPFLVVLFLFSWLRNGGSHVDNLHAAIDPAHPSFFWLPLVIVVLIELFMGVVLAAFYAFAFRQLAPNWNPPPELAAVQIDT